MQTISENSRLIEQIMQQEGIQFAFFDANLTLEPADCNLMGEIPQPGTPLSEIIPELAGMENSLRASLQLGRETAIHRINRTQGDRSQYLDLRLVPFGERLLVILKDTTRFGDLEQGIIQQRNEMILLNTQLEKSHHLLEELSALDDLTKLPNRRAAQQLFQHRLQQARASGIAMSVIFLDLDNFKGINDLYGHENGDLALKTLADILRLHIRVDDVAVRWGGDEFLIILEDGEFEGAKRISNHLLSIFKKQPLLLPGGIQIHLKASLGICLVRAAQLERTNLQEIIHVADRAMYISKRRGGAQVTLLDLGDTENLLHPLDGLPEFILESQSIQYAVFTEEGLLVSASGDLGKWLSMEIHPGQTLEELFPELSGMITSIQTSIREGRDMEIDYVSRSDWHDGTGYMNLQIQPFEDKILLLVKDSSALGNLERRLMQQRNELALLNNQLEKSRSQLLNMAIRFVPGQVVESLMASREAPSIHGSRREATVVFADLRGFSQWALEREPEEVFNKINTFLAQAVRIVLAYNGTLDKFLGDGFMVVFNAPHDQPDHILRAVQLAEEISRLEEDGLRFGVGIHSGVVMSGNIGAEQVMNYTVLGHTVNLAKRIEEAAAPGEVLMTAVVAENIGGQFETEVHASLQENGKGDPLAVYRLVRRRDQGTR
jgi:diguanylate cyclase (GGDEF)-like protein